MTKKIIATRKRALTDAEIESKASDIAHLALMRRLKAAKRGKSVHGHGVADVQFWCRAYQRAARRLMADPAPDVRS